MLLDGEDIFVLAGRELEELLHEKEASPLFSLVLASWWVLSNKGQSQQAALWNNLAQTRYGKHLQSNEVDCVRGFCKLPYPSMFPALFWREISSDCYEGALLFLDAPEQFIYHLAKYGYSQERPQAFLNQVKVAEQTREFKQILLAIHAGEELS